MMLVNELVTAQRNYFQSHATLPYKYRVGQLKKLHALLLANETNILKALYDDLKKSHFEGWGTEIGICEAELKLALNHLKKWMTLKKVKTPLFHFRSKSYIHHTPYGVTCIIAPWNYPFMLAIRPAIGALAAGNTVILKPSELAPATSICLEKIINTNFAAEYFHVVNTDAAGTQQLLKEKLDHIFFTGSTKTGKLVYEAAAKNLTPCSLELGGKSPCIVDQDIDISVAAKRIVWGKFTNCGQTCVSPDYILIHESIKNIFIAKLIENIEHYFGDDPEQSNDYGKIINETHFIRLINYLNDTSILYGGKSNKENLFISPTILDISDINMPVMQEEIFGPILPVLSYKTIDEALHIIQENPNPLACYLFTNDKSLKRKIMLEVPCGDMSVNETLFQFAHEHLPVGGIGNSGIGKYIGEYSFDKFSHKKSIIDKKFFPDLSIRYPPYNEKKITLLKWVMRKWM